MKSLSLSWVLIGALWLATGQAQTGGVELGGTTTPGAYTVTLHSQLAPLSINRMHSWIISVRDKSGIPVTDLALVVQGGMPLHNHGLPTQPQVTRELGDGQYLLEGMRFHMHGDWELKVEFDSPQGRESLTLALAL